MRPSPTRFAFVSTLLTGLACFASVGCGATARPSAPPPAVLPLTAVRLYETGIGYFERSGVISAPSPAALPVPASHLDDALASLVVLSRGRDPLRGLAFPSHVSPGMARAMAGLPDDLDAPVTYRDLLASLRGARVEVRSRGATRAGRLVEIEGPAPAPSDDDAAKPGAKAPLSLVLVTDAGEVVRIDAASADAIRPTDPAHVARLDAALGALSSRAAQGRATLDVLGASPGPVTLAYVAEAPVWRATYRFVVGADGAGILQGWALLHNDTDEDWRDVKVELVNGCPDSFLFPLAAPRYARRALVAPDDDLSTVPQLQGTTVDALAGDRAFARGDSGSATVYGTGEGHGALGGAHAAPGVAVRMASPILSVGDLAPVESALGADAGALFVYALPARVALRAHGSALVPFLQGPIDAEPITWADPRESDARTGVRLVNSTHQTLPAGTFAVFDGGGFAGESALDRLEPGARRFVRFGADLDVALRVTGSKVDESVERLTFERDAVVAHFVRTTRATYAFESRAAKGRAVYVPLRVDRNGTITGADAVDYDAASATPLAVVRLAARARVERGITSTEGLAQRTSLAELDVAKLAAWAASPRLAAGDKAIAAEALERQREVERAREAVGAAEAETQALEAQLDRLRDDAKALGGDHGAPPPGDLVRRILAAEDRLAALRRRSAQVQADRDARDAAVARVLARLTPS